MESIIGERIRQGSALTDAQLFLESVGFDCRQVEKPQGAERDEAGHELNLLWCDRHDQINVFVTRRWQVCVWHRNGEVANVKVTTGLIGP